MSALTHSITRVIRRGARTVDATQAEDVMAVAALAAPDAVPIR